jgi:hypothetical protein
VSEKNGDYNEFIQRPEMLWQSMGGGNVPDMRFFDTEKKAKRLVKKTRQKVYGSPSVNAKRTAKLWSVILGHKVDPKEVALCLIALKLGRLIETPDDRDTQVDVVGYIHYLQEILKEEK